MIPVSVTYNVHHHLAFASNIATYFFLTGLSAGSFVISVLSTLGGKKEFKPAGRIGAVLAPLLLIVAPTFLLIDLEQPLRFWYLFVFLNPTSPITWGSFLLTIYPLNCLVYAWFTFTNNTRLARTFGIVGIPLAVAVHGYTGFIVGLAKARVLWNTGIMPVIFLTSAMVSGVALVTLVSMVRARFVPSARTAEAKQQLHNMVVALGGVLLIFLVADVFLTFCDVLVLLVHTEDAVATVNLVRFGAFRFLFLGVELGLGAVIPTLLLILPKTRRSQGWLAVACTLTLIGIYAMRYVLVVGGQSIPQS